MDLSGMSYPLFLGNLLKVYDSHQDVERSNLHSYLQILFDIHKAGVILEDGRPLVQHLLDCESIDLWFYLQLAWTEELCNLDEQIFRVLDHQILRLMYRKTHTEDLSGTGSRLTQLMLQAAVTHNVYPSPMLMTEDIQWESICRTGGSFGDIYFGENQGRAYAKKSPRIFKSMVESPKRFKLIQKASYSLFYCLVYQTPLIRIFVTRLCYGGSCNTQTLSPS